MPSKDYHIEISVVRNNRIALLSHIYNINNFKTVSATKLSNNNGTKVYHEISVEGK